jgi:phage terminase large subunit
MPYQQLIGDCNPDAPTHWLRQRAQGGKTVLLESRHEDNPVLFQDSGAITQEGARYISTLDALSGVRLARYRYGIWAAAEGTVYEDSWDRNRNVIDRFDIPRSWQRYLAVDFGYTHPFACLWGAVDDDGRLYIYRQIYMTKRLVEDHAHDIAVASGWFHLLPRTHDRYNARPAEWSDPLPRDIICDHDAEDRATLERHLGLYTVPAKKTVSDGIQAVASRFRLAGDGKPRIMILRDCLVERDRELAQSKRPTCLEDEPDGYIWKVGGGIKAKEEPVKVGDDALDALRYLVAYHDLAHNDVSYFPDIWI